MSQYPIHKSSQISDFGIYIQPIETPKMYSHTDDFYIFGLVESGCCRLNIDFEDIDVIKGDIIIIRPGQVHRFVKSLDLIATMLILDEVFINESEQQLLEMYSLQKISLTDMNELKQLYSFLTCRLKYNQSETSKTIVQRMAVTVVALVVDVIQKHQVSFVYDRRYKEITLKFRKLFKQYFKVSRIPSFYANLLNISTSYLNEALHEVTGISVSRNIQNEIVLMAKRELVYTSASVKEIAQNLGFDDYSYFSRLFSKVTGVSPSNFRRTYCE